MKKHNIATLLLAASLAASAARAGVPLNGLQGTGGIAFNPVAFTAGTYADDDQLVSTPQFGAWYTRLDGADIDWAAASAALSVAKRLELSYGYGWTDANQYGDDSISTHNLGLKLNVLPDGAFDLGWLPAVSVGGVYKHTDSAPPLRPLAAPLQGRCKATGMNIHAAAASHGKMREHRRIGSLATA